MSSRLGILPPEALNHLAAFKREIEEALPGRIAQVTLFGSRARGDAEEDSDYDVAVFVTQTADGSDVQDVVSGVAHPHLLAGIYISPIVLPADYLDHIERYELAGEIARDGIALP